MSYLKAEHHERVANAYHAFKDVEGFAKVASLADIRTNDCNLSIPLYVRGKGVAESQGEYATDGLMKAIQMWNESAEKIKYSVSQVLRILENEK
jgi:type I restriction enzyme M protein